MLLGSGTGAYIGIKVLSIPCPIYLRFLDGVHNLIVKVMLRPFLFDVVVSRLLLPRGV